LIPRVLLADRVAITAPAEGLLVYQTNDVEGFYYYDGMQWLNLLSTRSEVGVVPIGSIIAWHGSIGGGVGALPDGWVRCQGGSVNDTDSPIYGRPIPNLNANTVSASNDGSRGRFLRGSYTSGIYESDQANRLDRIYSTGTAGQTTVVLPANGAQVNLRRDDGAFSGTDGYYLRLRGVENRPTNMSVIWIMRIK
jgi:hypothetical protein